ncbi:bifunctional adenosylcobinamide kinase/adenosylcobinamide-phosphate guanylyltransferase [Thermaurantiacus sp.]
MPDTRLSNLLNTGQNPTQATDTLLAALGTCQAETILVANEVGLGIIPETPLGRTFRDDTGQLHQRTAAHANNVALMVAVSTCLAQLLCKLAQPASKARGSCPLPPAKWSGPAGDARH